MRRQLRCDRAELCTGVAAAAALQRAGDMSGLEPAFAGSSGDAKSAVLATS